MNQFKLKQGFMHVAGVLLLSLLMIVNVQAAQPVFKIQAQASMQQVYPKVYEALEEARFFVVFEPQISKNIKRFADRWGDNYNRNRLSEIRSMVFCHVWYANEVSNKDPDMLGLCPLRIGLYEKDAKTSVVFVRPTHAAQNSPAKAVLQEVEDEVIKAIQSAMSSF